jgi:predicted enzyme related to lactoylglutathione lyase
MPQRASAPLGAPCWVDLFTSDPDRARLFYGELLGWVSESAGPEYGGYINFSHAGLPVAGCMANDGSQGAPDMWSVYLATDSAAATVEAAVAHGGQASVPAMAVGDLGHMAMMVDSGGAAIGAWQPGRHPGFTVLGEPGTPNWFELHARDYAGSLKFYAAVFQGDVHTMSDTSDFRYSTLGEGPAAVAGIMDAGAFLPTGAPARWVIYFGTANIDTALERLVELGGSVVIPAADTPFGRIAEVCDPTGALFRLVTPPAS